MQSADIATDDGFSTTVEQHRGELRLHCYRMTGSLDDAEDCVQEAMLRAWRALPSFQGRASARTWLYRIATNVCLDALAKRSRRSLPSLTSSPGDPGSPPGASLPESLWLDPFPDDLLPDPALGPEANYLRRESISLAFLTALQLLTGRQRAALILHDVLDWQANEVAALLETPTEAVSSLLHRARSTLRARAEGAAAPEVGPPLEEFRGLLDRYLTAWEAADVPGLVALLKEDVVLAMPPSPTWFSGRDAMRTFLAARVFRDGAVLWRLVPTGANGHPAFAQYLRQTTGPALAVGVQVITLDTSAGPGRISSITSFMLPRLFAAFGLPPEMG